MIEGPRPVGNINLYTFTTGHDLWSWETSGRALAGAIARFPLIIPEYYPPEYEALKNRGYPVVSGWVEYFDLKNNYLFHEVARICQEQKKDVWVVDPAYSEAYIIFSAFLLHAPTSATLAFLGRKLGQDFLKQFGERRVSRRGFLRGGAAAVALYSAGSTVVGAAIGPNKVLGPSIILGNWENEFRDSQSAEHIVDLGKFLPAPTDALMIGPEKHRRRVEKFLDDEAERRVVLGQYQWLKRFYFFKPLFKKRHYPEGFVQAA